MLKYTSCFLVDMSIIRYFYSWVAGNGDGCQRGHDLGPSTKLGRTRALPASSRGKEGPSSIKEKAEVRKGSLLAPVSFFQACVAPTSCQWPLGTLGIFLTYFYFIYFLFLSFFFLFSNHYKSFGTRSTKVIYKRQFRIGEAHIEVR